MRAIGPLIALAVLLTSAGAAFADQQARAEKGHRAAVRDRSWGPSVSLAGGIVGFIATGAREVIGPGLGWDVRVSLGKISEIRTELAYTGSAQRLTEGGAMLVGHGAQGLLRVNVTPRSRFESFLYMGVGWSRFHVDTPSSDDLVSPDHVLEVPFGGGVALRLGAFVFDIRAGMSILSGADLLPSMDPTTSERSHTMHRFSSRAAVGLEL